MLSLYGRVVSSYAEICRMTLNKWITSRTVPAQRHGMVITACLLMSLPVWSAEKSRQAASAHGAKTDVKVAPLAREIRHQLAALPFYSVFDSITFVLDEKKVTL